jgi:hypothetical protein
LSHAPMDIDADLLHAVYARPLEERLFRSP